MVTTRHESQAFSGNVLNLKTNLNHNKVIAAVVFYQLATKNYAGAAGDRGPVDYTGNSVLNNGLVHYYADSYKINTTSMYVEIGGIRYHATDIPTA